MPLWAFLLGFAAVALAWAATHQPAPHRRRAYAMPYSLGAGDMYDDGQAEWWVMGGDSDWDVMRAYLLAIEVTMPDLPRHVSRHTW